MMPSSTLLTVFVVLLNCVLTSCFQSKLYLAHQIKVYDGVERLVEVFNETFPGPTIRVSKEDTVEITIENNLVESVSTVHWHGIWQTDSSEMDGVGYLTQWPIVPEIQHTYSFSVGKQVGTHWYHSHTGSSRMDGSMGPLIVEDPDDPLEGLYDEEIIIMINDWYKTGGEEQVSGLLHTDFRWVGNPDAILYNGRGVYEEDGSDKSSQRAVFEVESGKTYRLRLIQAGVLNFFNFAVEGHTLTVVEADGTYVDPYVVSSLYMTGGERYSVLLTADQAVDNYWMNTEVRFRSLLTGTAVLRYQGAASADPARSVPPNPDVYWEASTQQLVAAYDVEMATNGFGPAAAGLWNAMWEPVTDAVLQQQSDTHSTASVMEEYPLPAVVDRAFVLLTTQERFEDDLSTSRTPYNATSHTYANQDDTTGKLRWAVNGHTFQFSDTVPLVERFRKTFDAAAAEEQGQALVVGSGEVVQIVLQNTIALNFIKEQHPWHLHGHSFWVVGSGSGWYDSDTDEPTFNLANPAFKDSVSVVPGGWTAIRFVADNPGVWALHCHIDFHAEMGMMVYLVEGEDEELSVIDPKQSVWIQATYEDLVNGCCGGDDEEGRSSNDGEVTVMWYTYLMSLVAVGFISGVVTYTLAKPPPAAAAVPAGGGEPIL